MTAPEVTILDYGLGNILNVSRGFSSLTDSYEVTAEPARLREAKRLVVPGVGAFERSISAIRELGFDDLIRDFVDTGRPFLGICVGMQMLFEVSEEFGEHAGLGILKGRVVSVPSQTTEGHQQCVPHIGWNALMSPESGRQWDETLLEGTADDEAMYFVHSFAAEPADEAVRLADCKYGGHRLSAAIQQDNIMATQFHPERSGEKGLMILRRFMGI